MELPIEPMPIGFGAPSAALYRSASQGRGLSGDVPEVVHRIVDLIAGERFDREGGAVAAATGALELLWR